MAETAETYLIGSSEKKKKKKISALERCELNVSSVEPWQSPSTLDACC
jgi:hypothetical protein